MCTISGFSIKIDLYNFCSILIFIGIGNKTLLHYNIYKFVSNLRGHLFSSYNLQVDKNEMKQNYEYKLCYVHAYLNNSSSFHKKIKKHGLILIKPFS